MEADPRYNIRAVERLTGVPAPTLRSWERRYGFPAPARANTARRLYSDEDIRVIRWVRSQTERGLSAGQAIEWAQAGGIDQDRLDGPALPSPQALIQARLKPSTTTMSRRSSTRSPRPSPTTRRTMS